MINDILIVDSVPDVVKRFGIERFRDQVLQEQGGHYFFVDIDDGCEEVKRAEEKNRETCERCPEDEGACLGCTEDFSFDCGDCSKCIKPIPLKIAWFILQAIRLQREAFSLRIPPSNEEIEEIFKRIESQEDQI